MKRIFVIILFSFLFYGIRADEQNDSISTLQTFIESNPKCWSKKVVYEGCNVLLCSDGESLFIQFKILHPAIQMRVLMQGLIFYIDPTGRKREKYSVVFPSANDVKEQMQSMGPARLDKPAENMKRPDIRPLINSLSQYGAAFDVNGKSTFVSGSHFAINLNEKNASLIYTLLIPIKQMLEEKRLSDEWRLGLYSQGGRHQERGPEFGGMHVAEHDQINVPPKEYSEKKDQKDIQNLLMKDIEEWISFSLSTICSLN